MSERYTTAVYPTCDKCGQMISGSANYVNAGSHGLRIYHPECSGVSQFTDAQLAEIKKLIEETIEQAI